MRLIDADMEVTAQLFDDMYEEYREEKMPISAFLDLYTNEGCPSAEPTVDKDYLVSLIQEAVYDGEACKRLLDLVDRPQGVWIPCTKSGLPLTEMMRREGQKWYGYRCSNCNYIYKGNALVECNFCKRCGARMKGVDDE